MNENIEIGKINRLKIERFTEPGIYLIAKDEEVVLLPNQYVKESMKEGDEIDVFIYTDSEDRIVATTQKPIAMMGEFGCFKVVDTTKFGAFVDWGLLKDLFVPRKFQKTPFKVGETRILFVDKDEKTDRLIGDERLKNHLNEKIQFIKQNTKVNLLVIAKTPMGYKCIVDNSYEAMLFKDEVFEKLEVGDSRLGYVKHFRDDGKLDVSLQPIGSTRNNVMQDKVIDILKQNGGSMNVTSKSDPELIKEKFGLSKKAFKAAVTALKLDGKLKVSQSEINLI